MPSTTLPEWIQYAQALGPTIVAMVVGCIAAYVAWRQWKTAHYRLRLDLFDRRLRVFVATRNLLNKAIINGQLMHRDLHEFAQASQGAEFLFDGPTKQYFQTINELCHVAAMARLRQQRDVPDDQYKQLIREEEAILEFLEDAASRVEQQFRAVLDLSRAG